MPRGDRTGPEGYGPMTGRGLGYGGGYGGPGFRRKFQTGGQRQNRAGNRFGGRWIVEDSPGQPSDEMSELRSEVETLHKDLIALNRKLEALRDEEGSINPDS